MGQKRVVSVILGASAALLAGGAIAAGLSGEEAAKDRIEHMKAQGAAAKAIGEQLKSGAPDAAVVKLNAAKLDASAKALPNWFPAGSGPSAYAKSHALPLIWSDAATFKAKAAAYAAAAAKLDAVAQAGDMAAVGPAMREVGAACKGCHETFKAKDPA